MSLYQCYLWNYRIDVPPMERLLSLVDAFFSSYPQGEFTRESREEYKLSFRRGMWKRLAGLGPMVPARLVAGEFTQWPILVHVLARPSPERFQIAVRYELYLPRQVKSLVPEVQSSVHQHIRVELDDLSAYLAECGQLAERPAVHDLPPA